MTRRTVVLAVATIAMLAGCSGGALVSDGSSPASTDEQTTQNAPPLADRAWTDGDQVAFEALVARHHAVLSNATSYRHAVRATSGDKETFRSVAVNLEANRMNLTIHAPGESTTNVQESFVDDGALYSKSGTTGDLSYSHREDAIGEEALRRVAREQSRLQVTAASLSQWDFEYVGYEDGAYRFEADAVTPAEDTGGGIRLDLANATDAHATLVVSEDGVIRRVKYDVTIERDGETRRVVYVSTYSDINATTVSEPAWTSKAS